MLVEKLHPYLIYHGWLISMGEACHLLKQNRGEVVDVWVGEGLGGEEGGETAVRM